MFWPMPSRNIVKQDGHDTFFHVYARGASKQAIFLNKQDYSFFINLFPRYLSAPPSISKNGTPYPLYTPQLRLLAYCLMSNHFHLLVHQEKARVMTSFMHSVMTSYGRYFNLRYRRSGSPFESTYKACAIEDQSYLEHITRYIHLNPRHWKRYPHSSLQFYRSGVAPDWLTISPMLDLFTDSQEYMQFVADYEDHKLMLEEIKNSLANTK